MQILLSDLSQFLKKTMVSRCVAMATSSGLLPFVCNSGRLCGASFSKPEHVSSANCRRYQLGLEQRCVLAIAPALNRGTARLPYICRRAGAPGDDDKEIERDPVVKSELNGKVEEIEKALGQSFGGAIWFAVLLVCVTVFGGGYVYLIYNFADFSDIPILNGPQGL